MAGFQVSISGRIWVSTEAMLRGDNEPRVLGPGCIQKGTLRGVESSVGERQQYAAKSMVLQFQSPSISLALGFVLHSVVTCGDRPHDPV